MDKILYNVLKDDFKIGNIKLNVDNKSDINEIIVNIQINVIQKKNLYKFI